MIRLTNIILLEYLWLGLVITFGHATTNPSSSTHENNEIDVAKFLAQFNNNLAKINNHIRERIWKDEELQEIDFWIHQKFDLLIEAYSEIKKYNLVTEEKSLKRQLELFSQIGPMILPRPVAENLDINSENAIKEFTHPFLEFEAIISEKLTGGHITIEEAEARDRDSEEKWTSFSKTLTSNLEHRIRKHFALIREASALLNIDDPVEFWMYVNNYGTDFSEREIMDLWHEAGIEKSYSRFFSVTRSHLESMHVIDDDNNAPFPAFLYDIMSNYGSDFAGYNLEALEREVEKNLKNRKIGKLNLGKYRIEDMAREVESFFVSLDFPKLQKSFWEASEFVCANVPTQLSVQEVFSPDEYFWMVRGSLSHETFYKLHQHMFRLYRNLLVETNNIPTIFKQQDYEPFYDAFEAAVIMSAKSYNRAIELNFLKNYQKTQKLIMQNLLAEATSTFTKLASALAVDSWKWDVLRGNIKKHEFLTELWNRRLRYEKVVPVVRAEAVDKENLIDCFNSYYSFPDELTYKNFTTIILKYQIFASLCEKADQYDPSEPLKFPLYDCDISGHISIGQFLIKIIREGSSEHWRDLLFKLTGHRELIAKPLMDYFEPLFNYYNV